MARSLKYSIYAALFAALAALSAAGQALTLGVESLLVEDVGGAWKPAYTVNTYTDPVIVCTYNLPSSASNDAIVRIDHTSISSNQFSLRVQQFETSNTVTTSDVHCLIAEVGTHLIGGTHPLEARKVESTVTAGSRVGWAAANTTDVDAIVTGTYSTPLIYGQVMSFKDTKASAFWSNNCSNRGTPATNANMCVGKHIGRIDGTRNDETLGFIVTQPGTGTVNDVTYAFARGADSIRGVGDSPPYTYTVAGDFDVGVLSNAAEDGGDGSWAVLYGADPLPNNQIRLAVEEETFANTSNRRHTHEEVNYAVFKDDQTPDVTASKSTELYTGTGDVYAIPGSDVIYTLSVESIGSAPLDPDTLFMVDSLGDEVTFYNGDIDDGGPETGAIAFDPKSSGLTFDPINDVGFSTAVARPTSFTACSAPVSSGYDPSIRHVCINPKGRMKGGTLEPDTDFTWSFRARVD